MACSSTVDPAPAAPQVERRSDEIASLEGDVEWEIDVPWRLEPSPGPAMYDPDYYPEIPIVISIHDATMQADDESRVPYGEFCALTVHESWNRGAVPPAGTPDFWDTDRAFAPGLSPNLTLREVQRSDKWPRVTYAAANQSICRRWQGQSCTWELDVGTSAEWHATYSYRPHQYDWWNGIHPANNYRNGDGVHLYVEALLARAGRPCSSTNPNDFIRSYRDLWVHLGEAPLPRFDPNWLYGDLHYHSEGTDNEGESAHAYRPTLQAMRAMGLDFAFATDHASNSGQVTDIDEIFIDNIPFPDWVPNRIQEFVLGLVEDTAVGAQQQMNALRDMSPQRYEAMLARINDPATGANAELLKAMPGRASASRLFLGGEVDVVPEMSAEERNNRRIYYGNGKEYRWDLACTEVPDPIKLLVQFTTAVTCDNPFQLAEITPSGSYVVKDIQGMSQQYPARQHLLHLPKNNLPEDVPAGRETSFISGQTEVFGGATRAFPELLQREYVSRDKGYAFLAHPVAAASGSDMGRLGPDIVPYSDLQLRRAFDNASVLGLQAWNEDTRIHGDKDTQYGLVWLGAAPPAYDELHHGVFAWDKMLQWGLRPSMRPAWVPQNEPRRVFMAGGSDAHGDWNYRREGAIEGQSGRTDTALGKPRNLVNVGSARPESIQGPGGITVPAVSQEQVTAALASGEFSVTDGPALRIAVDQNANGIIDDGDLMMGDFGNIAPAPATSYPVVSFDVLVEWKSTYEFSRVKSIDLYVGSAAGEVTLVYAAPNHGIHTPRTPQGTPEPFTWRDHYGNEHGRLNDGYMRADTLHLEIAPSDGIAGVRKVKLTPGTFRTGTFLHTPAVTAHQECTEVCSEQHGCHSSCTLVPAQPERRTFIGAHWPEQLYVRAFARTAPVTTGCVTSPYGVATTNDHPLGRCAERLAFTNPVWLRVPAEPEPPPPPPPPPLEVGDRCDGSRPCPCESFCPAATPLAPNPPECTLRFGTGSRCANDAWCNAENWCSAGLCAARLPIGAACGGRGNETPCVENAVCSNAVCTATGEQLCLPRSAPRTLP